MKMKTKSSPIVLLLLAFVFLTHSAAKAQNARLHEGYDNSGAYEDFGGENIYLNGYMNNKASSITVGDGLFVNTCDEHLQREKGDPSCKSYPEGKYRFVSLNKRVSYINVQRPKTSPYPKSVVCLYTGFNGMGDQKCYEKSGEFPLSEYVGTYPMIEDGVPASKWSDTVSSIWVSPNYFATVNRTMMNAQGSITVIGRKYQAGINNLDSSFNNAVLTVRIERRFALFPLPNEIKTKKILTTKSLPKTKRLP